MAVRLPDATRNAAADAVVDLVDVGASNGKVEIYTGTQPATGGGSHADTLLATFTLAATAFGASAAGVATLAGTPIATTGVAAGTAGWFRMFDGAATPAAVMDGSVTATGGGGDMTVDNTSIAVDQTVNLTSGTVTMPAG